MSGARTQQLAFGDSVTGGSDVVVYTVPVGKTAILKRISLVNLAAGTRLFSVGWRKAGLVVSVAVVSVAGSNQAAATLYDVGEPGDELTIIDLGGAAGSSWRYIASGSELDN